MVLTREETIPRICRKKDSGGNTTCEKKKRKAEAETLEQSGQQKMKSMT